MSLMSRSLSKQIYATRSRGTYGDNRVIPLVLRYNGTVYEKSMNMLTTFLPEITDSFLSKHCCLAVARANEEAKLVGRQVPQQQVPQQCRKMATWPSNQSTKSLDVARNSGCVLNFANKLFSSARPTFQKCSYNITNMFLGYRYANEEAKLHYTSLITNALHEGTIAMKQGQ
ncbi:Hypothetical_protein [Hexamita inflata]|uniref:Hypothetical_protein n=1 Tax=Hexamita inflata TaxID=28002 RepID=A0ABP1J650_9EUKA